MFSMQNSIVCVLLQVVLLMGNYMNTGSRNAQSYGFDLSYLNKVKKSNGQGVPGFSVSLPC